MRKTLNFVERLIEHAKAHRGFRSDAQLAEAVGVSRAQMSWIKNGQSGISAEILQILLDGYDAPIERNDLLDLISGDVVGVIRQHDVLIARLLAEAPVLRRSRAGPRKPDQPSQDART